MMTFGEKLKAARQAQGYTQKELAGLIGAKHNSISNWENNQNKPDPDSIELLCGVLKVSANYFFGGNDSIRPSDLMILKKYNALDERGKETVRNILDIEFNRTSDQRNNKNIHTLSAAADTGENITVELTEEQYRKSKDLERSLDPRRTSKKD